MTLASQERLVRYVNGALLSVYDELVKDGFTDMEAGNMLGSAFDAGQRLIDRVTSNTYQHCWDLSIPGNAFGHWIRDGGPLLAIEGPDGGMLVHLPILEWLANVSGGQSLASQCAEYFSSVDLSIADFAAELSAAGAGPAWLEVLTAAHDEAITRATPDLAVPFSIAVKNFWKAIPAPVRVIGILYMGLRIRSLL